MQKKKKSYKGYLLSEGLFALLVMSVALSILIPHLIQFKKNASILEEKVICARLLYEETQHRVGKGTQLFLKVRDGVPYEVFLGEKGIMIKRGGVEVGFQEN